MQGVAPWLRSAAVAFLLLGASPGVGAQEPIPPPSNAEIYEYQVKAAFLFNFAKFVEWPAAALPDNSPLRVGIWAPEASFEVMATVLAGKEVASHALVVIRYTQETDPPHILFVHEDIGAIPSEQLRRFAMANVLLVGETPDFAARYGTIGIVPRDEKLSFQVNVAAAKRAQLTISGQLARLAEIVRDKP